MKSSIKSLLILVTACVVVHSSPHPDQNEQPIANSTDKVALQSAEVAVQELRIVAVQKFCDGYLDAFNKTIGDKKSTNSTNSTNSTIDVSFFETAEFICRTVKLLNSNEITLTSAIPLDYFCDNVLKAPTDYYVDEEGNEHYPSKDSILLTLSSDVLCIDFKREMQLTQSSQAISG